MSHLFDRHGKATTQCTQTLERMNCMVAPKRIINTKISLATVARVVEKLPALTGRSAYLSLQRR